MSPQFACMSPDSPVSTRANDHGPNSPRPGAWSPVLIAVMVFSALSVGCILRPNLTLNEPEESPGAGDFADVRAAWTRSESVVPFSGFDNVLTVTGTFLSRAFRAAYVSRYARDYALSADERGRLEAQHRLEYSREAEFFLTAYSGSEFREADLADPDRGWRILLVTPRGRRAPTRLEKIQHPSAAQRAYFPHVSRQRMAFVVGFVPDILPEDRWFELQIRGAKGQAVLHWDLQRSH